MRKDQPEIKKHIKDLTKTVNLYENLLDLDKEIILNLQQELLIKRIECNRLRSGKPKLTK